MPMEDKKYLLQDTGEAKVGKFVHSLGPVQQDPYQSDAVEWRAARYIRQTSSVTSMLQELQQESLQQRRLRARTTDYDVSDSQQPEGSTARRYLYSST